MIGVSVGNESISNWVNEIKTNTQPTIIPNVNEQVIQGKTIIVFSIMEFPIKPIAYKGRYYRRVKNSNHQLDANEITEMNMHSLQLSWDSYE